MFTHIDTVETLRGIPCFFELSASQSERLAQIATIKNVDEGDVIFSEGDKVDNIYFILSGHVGVEMFIPTKGIQQIYTAEPLDMLGWSSLTPVIRQRTATAIALSTCCLVVFNAAELTSLCENDHDIGYIITRRLSNVIASRILATRLQLMQLITQEK